MIIIYSLSHKRLQFRDPISDETTVVNVQRIYNDTLYSDDRNSRGAFSETKYHTRVIQ